MSRAIVPLLLVLLIQCALVFVVYWPEQIMQAQPDEQHLSSSSPEVVEEIRIGDEYDNEALLRRAGNGWLLPELGDLPADTKKVARLLAGILPADPGWPVAETAAARQRFHVADYRYQRRLTLLRAGEVLDTIYLGTAPSFRKVYARNNAAESIFTIAFSNHEAPARDDAWLDARILQIRGPLSITGDAYSIHWKDGNWLSGSGAQPDERELQALLGALRSLQVEGVASEDDQRELSQSEAQLVLQVDSLGGDVTLELFILEGKHYIYSSAHSLFFKLSAYDYDRLTGIDFMLISGEDLEPAAAQ